MARVGEVLRSSWLTPQVVRGVLGGDGLPGFPAGEFTDHCVEMLSPRPACCRRSGAVLVEDLRLHLRAERGLDPQLTSISGCWRLGRTEDRWQAEKRDWNAEVEAAEQALAG